MSALCIGMNVSGVPYWVVLSWWTRTAGEAALVIRPSCLWLHLHVGNMLCKSGPQAPVICFDWPPGALDKLGNVHGPYWWVELEWFAHVMDAAHHKCLSYYIRDWSWRETESKYRSGASPLGVSWPRNPGHMKVLREGAVHCSARYRN